MGKKKHRIKERDRNKFKKLIKRDGDIPHRFYDTPINVLEENKCWSSKRK